MTSSILQTAVPSLFHASTISAIYVVPPFCHLRTITPSDLGCFGLWKAILTVMTHLCESIQYKHFGTVPSHGLLLIRGEGGKNWDEDYF